MASRGEKLVGAVLRREFGISIISTQYRHPRCPLLPYDVQFIHQQKEYYLEYDGMQHFVPGVKYVRSLKKFESLQMRDKIKTLFAIVGADARIIRIDYDFKTYSQIKSVLAMALSEDRRVFFSNDEKYNYIRFGEIPINLYRKYVN